MSSILDQKMFSINDIADAAGDIASEIRGMRGEDFLKLFIHAMRKQSNGGMRYVDNGASLDYNKVNSFQDYQMQMHVRDYWTDVEDALFAPKKSYNPFQSPGAKLHIRCVVDVGMFGEGDDKFFVIFANGDELEFDTWTATDKHLNQIASKCRWVTDNDRPKLSKLEWLDDDEEESSTNYITTTLPQGSASKLSGISNGMLGGIPNGNLSVISSSSNVLRKMTKP